MKKNSKVKVIDLFAGCGGLSLGFQNAGYSIVAAIDNWKPAIEVYKKNFDHEIYDIDLSDVDKAVEVINKYDVDMLVGGPPCQDFSHAGKRNENGGRGNLTVAYAEIIARVKPSIFVMENVDRLLLTEKYKQAFKILKEAGYGITAKLMDASLCGVPQKRKRWFVIGILRGEDNSLSCLLNKNLSKESTTLRDYFGNSLGTEYYYRHPRNYSRRGVYSIDEPSATIRGVNRPIPKGYPGHQLDATKDLSKVRPLTTEERGWIQTFPKIFAFSGSKTNMEQLIGNAVPVKLAEYVAKAILHFMDKKDDPDFDKKYKVNESNLKEQQLLFDTF